MTMTMTMTNLTEHILSPLVRGGSKAGIYYFEHRTHKKKGIDADKQNAQKPHPSLPFREGSLEGSLRGSEITVLKNFVSLCLRVQLKVMVIVIVIVINF